LKKQPEEKAPKKPKEVLCSGKNICKKEECKHRVSHKPEGCTDVRMCYEYDQAVKCKEVKDIAETDNTKEKETK